MEREEITQKALAYLASENSPFFSQQVRDLLAKDDFVELDERFAMTLDFGTAGLRGIIGGGYNRMNPYIVRQATQGLARYIVKAVPLSQSSVVIGYDSRNFSPEFAMEAALVLCGNGIRTFLFTSLRPTPEVSFAVRHLKATAGIVVTASHNPKEYNGYKVCWSDGGQIVAPHDKGIIQEVKSVTGSDVRSVPQEQALASGLLQMVDREVDDAYVAVVKSQALRPDLIRQRGGSLKVVYTPLHGAGGQPVGRVLEELGIHPVLVEEQRVPDGNFPTCKSPNPEERSALDLALKKAAEVKADLVMGTDPDSDRLGIAVPAAGAYQLVTGNQLGTLLADYIFSARRDLGTLPKRAALVKTIVTTDLQRLIAQDNGALCFDVLTGFKYIGEKIKQFEEEHDGPTYVFGGEESYGYLVGTSVRDKDAVGAAAMTAEMTLYHVSHGRSVVDRLNELYQRFGYFQEEQISPHFRGISGLEEMKKLMDRLRSKPPSAIAGQNVVRVLDYLSGTSTVVATGVKQQDIRLPSSNVLQFVLADQSIVTARPSGTEPKIKFYASCRSEAGMELDKAKKEVGVRMAALMAELASWAG